MSDAIPAIFTQSSSIQGPCWIPLVRVILALRHPMVIQSGGFVFLKHQPSAIMGNLNDSDGGAIRPVLNSGAHTYLWFYGFHLVPRERQEIKFSYAYLDIK